MKLEDLSREFGVSCERLRQLEVRAFLKVQEVVKKNLAQRERIQAAASGSSRGWISS
jgi:RNA polymerase sigma-32 factor